MWALPLKIIEFLLMAFFGYLKQVRRVESFVYILASCRNGTVYVGSTTNLVKRVWEHKNKVIPGFTAKYNVNQLVS
jgi:predicted GIY-YIG superfamily endonuclease